jgi:hypothetical protein
VQVAERVDVEHVREAGRKKEVLDNAREHVPGVAVEEGREDVDACDDVVSVTRQHDTLKSQP